MAEEQSYEPQERLAEALGQPVRREGNVFEESDERAEEEREGQKRLESAAKAEKETAQPGRLTSVRDEEGRKSNPLGMPNDPKRGYLGVDPIYQNAAEDKNKPLRSEEGPEKEFEDRAFAANAALDSQGLVTGPTGSRG